MYLKGRPSLTWPANELKGWSTARPRKIPFLLSLSSHSVPNSGTFSSSSAPSSRHSWPTAAPMVFLCLPPSQYSDRTTSPLSSMKDRFLGRGGLEEWSQQWQGFLQGWWERNTHISPFCPITNKDQGNAWQWGKIGGFVVYGTLCPRSFQEEKALRGKGAECSQPISPSSVARRAV